MNQSAELMVKLTKINVMQIILELKRNTMVLVQMFLKIFIAQCRVSFLKVDDYRDEDIGQVQRLLREVVERLPRRPWDFPLGQRLEAGLAIPEWGHSKRMWQRMAFDVGERTPKDWVPKGTLGDRMRGGPAVDVGMDDEGSEVRVEELVAPGDDEDQG